MKNNLSKTNLCLVLVYFFLGLGNCIQLRQAQGQIKAVLEKKEQQLMSENEANFLEISSEVENISLNDSTGKQNKAKNSKDNDDDSDGDKNSLENFFEQSESIEKKPINDIEGWEDDHEIFSQEDKEQIQAAHANIVETDEKIENYEDLQK